jgi:hypothetical protein
MPYGFVEKGFVEQLCAELKATDPQELEWRFVVMQLSRVDYRWGIVRYCRFPGRSDLGWMWNGFIWLEGRDIDSKLAEYRGGVNA